MIFRHNPFPENETLEGIFEEVERNPKSIENTINYCLTRNEIDPEGLTQTALRYCDSTLCCCELVNIDSQTSYTFLYYAYLFRYYACLVQSQEEVTLSFLKGSNTVKGLGSGVVFPDTFIQNYFNQDSHLSVILALIFRNTKALDLYAQLSFKPSMKDFYEDQKSRKRDYPWIANYKKGGSPIYAYRQNWALADYFVVLASRDTERSLEKTKEMITFFTNEVDYYNQREKEDLSLWWGDGYKESDLTPYSTGCLPLRYEKQQIEELILPLI